MQIGRVLLSKPVVFMARKFREFSPLALELLRNTLQIYSLPIAKPFSKFQLGKYFLLKIVYLHENLTGVDPRLLNTIILNYRRAFTYMGCTWMVLDGIVEAVN